VLQLDRGIIHLYSDTYLQFALRSPPANVRANEQINGPEGSIISFEWAGAIDDNEDPTYEIQRNGDFLVLVSDEQRAYINRRFTAGYFKYPTFVIARFVDSREPLESGLYSITTIDRIGKRSEP